MLWLLEYKCQSIIRAMYTPAFILQHPIAVAGVPEYNWFFSCLVIFYFFIRSSGFLFIRSSGFGQIYQLDFANLGLKIKRNYNFLIFSCQNFFLNIIYAFLSGPNFVTNKGGADKKPGYFSIHCWRFCRSNNNLQEVQVWVFWVRCSSPPLFRLNSWDMTSQ